MKVVETVSAVRQWSRDRRREGRVVALVPTLGYLHEGHLSLIEVARQNADLVMLSIFVNPLQFGPGEDFEAYPRNFERDFGLARGAGVDLAFTPSTSEMYPAGEPWIRVIPARGADRLCGAFRPGHFEGVLTVVAKLFGACEPDVAVFGRKDFQQLVLITRMVSDLNIGVNIIPAPTVRERDGLALSSRNQYLDQAGREAALSLSRALGACQRAFANGERDADVLRETLRRIAAEGVRVQYAEIVDPGTLEPVSRAEQGSVCAVAGFVGSTRLIDNTSLGLDPEFG